MPPEKVQILLSVVGLGINLFGFIFVIRQIRQQALATRGETYTSLCGLSYEILQMIAAKPYLYAFFYERRVLDNKYEHRVDVLMCCEMIANYIDNAFTQKENMPEAVFAKWVAFAREQINASIVLREFFEAYPNWYDDEIMKICRQNARNGVMNPGQQDYL